MYNYYAAMKKDVTEAMKEVLEMREFEDYSELVDYCIDEFWARDDITGNGGEYYWDTEDEAAEALRFNLSLTIEATRDFDVHLWDLDSDHLYNNVDCIIRTYLLSQVVEDVAEKLYEGE